MRTVLGILLPALLLACDRAEPYRVELFVFGTTVNITIAGLNENEAARTVGAINQRFNELHRDWHPWRPGLLTDINQAVADGRSHPVTAELADLIREARDYERRSGGRFNPAVGRLVSLWGFHTDDFPVESAAPAGEAIAEVVALAPSTADLRIENGEISSRNPSVSLDLSGIAKGAAVDWAIEAIKASGATGGLVNAGGDLRGYGERNGHAWRVGIRDPGDFELLATLVLDGDEAVFTSGNYARFRQDDNRQGHIIDPRTGWPVPHAAAATVVAPRGTLADAAATALVVAGPEHWLETARSMGIDEALIVDADGCVAVTRSLHPRLEFAREPDCITVVE